MTGILQKMDTCWEQPVGYRLSLDKETIEMNALLGRKISISWHQKIYCLHCGKATKKSFGQGYCYPCFMTAPENDACVLSPEKCQAHLGVARDMVFAEKHCLQDHIVYLALSSDIKVGVTRQSQVPTRWIDQGAWRAICLAKTPNRYTAGIMEVELKKIMPDKTNWRNMLKHVIDTSRDLLQEKQRIAGLLSGELGQYISSDNTIWEIQYPVLDYPVKPESIDLEKTNCISGILKGIKGQYLLFEGGKCLNIRKHGGFKVEFTVI